MKTNRFILSAVIGCVVLLSLLPSLTFAAPTVTAALPPRSTLTPSSVASTPEAAQHPGGTIILYLPTTRTDLWAVVQWQDGFGVWHDVETWRNPLGELSPSERWQVWAVYRQHFGLGPFRWMVYSQPGGQVYGYSDNFYLPKSSTDWVWVRVPEPAPTPTPTPKPAK